ncbi:MAG: hypothetical protein ABFD92_16475 [Planctomycetaceae bacterium]|nr:hypothetical protein [Planctomycetaceae bacterium]
MNFASVRPAMYEATHAATVTRSEGRASTRPKSSSRRRTSSEIDDNHSAVAGASGEP